MKTQEKINDIKLRWQQLGLYCGLGGVRNDKIIFSSDVAEANFHLQGSETKRQIGAIYQHIKKWEDDRGLFLEEVIKDLDKRV